MKRTIGSLAVILFSITSAYSQTSVTLTVIDELMNYQDVRFKGAFSDWALVQGYDDGTNGDLVAGDGHWTAVIENVNAGSYEWGAIDTDNGDGTTCSVCDGSDGWGTWLLGIIGLPNQIFTVDENGLLYGVTNITMSVLYPSVTLTVVDTADTYQDVRFKGAFSDWALVQGFDDGTNGDAAANDHTWTVIIDSVGEGSYEWGAIDTDNGDGTTCSVCDGSDGWGTWILDDFGLPNQVFTVDENGFVSGVTSIPPLVEDTVITKTVIFSVDMTEWLDEEGATGIPIFSVARGDTMQLRGGFNGWNCDDPADCILSRTPGTNIFSLALTLTDLPDHVNEYKFYMQHSTESVAHLSALYGELWDNMGWEDSPQFGGANRIFTLGPDDGTGILELPLAGYYDLPVGGTIPAGQTVNVMFSVDMTSSDANGFTSEDTVYLSIKDRWLKYLQGLEDDYKVIATANGDGTYSASSSFTGPFPWHMIYTWGFYDVSEMVYIEEGGGFGFGRFRARYQHANADDDCAWGDYTFPGDIWQLDPPLPLENYDPESVCSPLYGGWLSNGGFEDGIAGWYPYPDDNGSYAIEETGNNIYNSSDIFEAYEGSHSLKMWGQYSGSENYGSFGQWFEVGADELEVGSTVELNGMLMSHADDWIGQGWNSAYLIFYFYESDYTMIGWEMSSLIDSYSSSSEWIPLSVTATVPENTFQVWAGVEYYQASNDDHGSVYVDSVTMNVETLSTGDENNLPKQFILHDNYPNPFNPTTNIAFSIPEASDVKIYIYNILGQTVAVIDKGHLNAGNYDIRWSGMDQLGKTLSSGIYFYEMQAGDQFKQIKKMTLVK